MESYTIIGFALIVLILITTAYKAGRHHVDYEQAEVLSRGMITLCEDNAKEALKVASANCDFWRYRAEDAERGLQRKSYDAFHFFQALQLACFYKHKGSVAHNVKPSQGKIDRSVTSYLADTGYDPMKWEPKAADEATKEGDDAV